MWELVAVGKIEKRMYKFLIKEHLWMFNGRVKKRVNNEDDAHG